ncbi:MAG: class I SAM-dependent methyltransferase [Bacteroidetes bacterium]|nr:MAG: class I SAM-dependent methyltransferase [Bacteroidota bacterium]
MYHFFKSALNRIVSRRTLARWEPLIRKIYAAVFFRGSACRCPVCTHSFSKFILLPNGDRLCPFCGSLSRNRRLWKILTESEVLRGRVLHFSPSRPLYRRLKKVPEIEYLSTDFEDEFLADCQYDITRIPEPDEVFDLIICYHVLEHIPDDRAAMRELFRVLKKEGRALIQTPFRLGEIYENPTITTPADREKHFGQADHVRVYSVEGLKNRLEQAGFRVSVKKYSAATKNPEGLAEEVVLIAQK